MATGDEWSKEELRAAVDSYVDMLSRHREGLPFVKKQYYRDLAGRFGRTEKAFEYRAQNISYVLALQGRQWLPGLVPAKNVGPTVIAQIEQLLADGEGVTNPETATFESRVHAARKRKQEVIPSGNKKPAAHEGKATVYDRDPEVKAWVLNAANGTCEGCGESAPFVTADGEPFLEVHHVRQLADGGSDTTTNAVALCPNCHRALHYSVNRRKLVATLYKNVSRLVKE